MIICKSFLLMANYHNVVVIYYLDELVLEWKDLRDNVM